mmetsp:Transcript_46364/g.148045  ORF Transcript_46364/g.148045 Transcript_46364/m.148045 type:complete len:125 (+) Transcript_46364:243-617(+)
MGMENTKLTKKEFLLERDKRSSGMAAAKAMMLRLLPKVDVYIGKLTPIVESSVGAGLGVPSEVQSAGTGGELQWLCGHGRHCWDLHGRSHRRWHRSSHGLGLVWRLSGHVFVVEESMEGQAACC